MTPFEVAKRSLHLSQRIHVRDRNLEPLTGDPPNKLRQHLGARRRATSFGLHAVLFDGCKVDDRIDSVWLYAKLERQLDVVRTESVDERIDAPGRGRSDAIGNPLTVGYGNYTMANEPGMVLLAREADRLGPSI